MATTASAATTGTYRVRNCRGEDYDSVIASVDKWWSGRRVSRMLPRLFFEHFCDTSFVVELCTQKHYQSAAAGEDDPILSTSKSPTATKEGQVVGFLCGFVSQARAGEAHSHFIGVDPAHRGAGLGRLLYQHFFDAVKARGCTLAHAVTHPGNAASVAFHQKLGFVPRPVDPDNTIKGGLEVPVFDGAESGGTRISMSIVHVGWDGPDLGDRVLLDKHL